MRRGFHRDATSRPAHPRRIAGVRWVPKRTKNGAAAEADPSRAVDDVTARRARDPAPDPFAHTRSARRPQGAGRARGGVHGWRGRTGVIGASWAEQFSTMGRRRRTDPVPGAEERLRADVAAIWPTLGRAAGASRTAVLFSADAGKLRPARTSAETARSRQTFQATRCTACGRADRPRWCCVGCPSAADRDRPRLPRTRSGVIGHRSTSRTSPLVEVVPGEETAEATVRGGAGVLHRNRQEADTAATGVDGNVAKRMQARGAGGSTRWSTAAWPRWRTSTPHRARPRPAVAVLGPFLTSNSGGPGGIAHTPEQPARHRRKGGATSAGHPPRS